MRTLMRITVPVQPGNRTIIDGTLPRTIQATMETLRPEAAYFFVEGGKRTGLLVFDLKDPAQIPSVCEPLFQELEAEVEINPVMNIQDLQSGLGQWAASKR